MNIIRANVSLMFVLVELNRCIQREQTTDRRRSTNSCIVEQTKSRQNNGLLPNDLVKRKPFELIERRLNSNERSMICKSNILSIYIGRV
jgi:hypothetical protein